MPPSTPAPVGPMTLGYARGGPDVARLDAQVDALIQSGIDARRVYTDSTSQNRADDSRPGLTALLDYARIGDTVVVVGLDRLGRTPSEILATTRTLTDHGLGLRTLRERLDTGNPTGATIVGVLSALSPTDDRRPARRGRDRHHVGSIGRPRALTNDQIEMAQRLRDNGNPVPSIAARLGVSRATLYRAFAEHRGDQ